MEHALKQFAAFITQDDIDTVTLEAKRQTKELGKRITRAMVLRQLIATLRHTDKAVQATSVQEGSDPSEQSDDPGDRPGHPVTAPQTELSPDEEQDPWAALQAGDPVDAWPGLPKATSVVDASPHPVDVALEALVDGPKHVVGPIPEGAQVELSTDEEQLHAELVAHFKGDAQRALNMLDRRGIDGARSWLRIQP